MSSVLQELGPEAVAHRAEVEEVKKIVGIDHDYFDCWIYGFLENKKYNIKETVEKLQRRDIMEKTELATYTISDWMRQSMAKGTMQWIGDDKDGRVTFYVVTKRDFPTSETREETKKNFDMWASFGSRLRRENKRCRMALLVNQEDASMRSNTDMGLQADIALRIAKYYPGCVDKVFICKMGTFLSAVAKPIFSRLPAMVSDRIQIFSDSDIKRGKLLEHFDISQLPIALGGTNDCDHQENWDRFGTMVADYYLKLSDAVKNRGLSVKEFELEEVLRDEMEAEKEAGSGVAGREPFGEEMEEANDPERSDMADSLSVMRYGRHTGSSMFSVDVLANEPQGLMTCRSLNDDEVPPRQHVTTVDGRVAGGRYGSPTGHTDGPHSPHFLRRPARGLNRSWLDELSNGSGIYGSAWLEITAPLKPSLQLFFLEEMVRCRNLVEQEEQSTRLSLAVQQVKELGDIRKTDSATIDDASLYSGFPPPVQGILRIIFYMLTVVCIFYFVLGTAFMAIFCSNLIVTIFLASLIKPVFFFPLLCGLVVVAHQGTLICSRGYDILSHLICFEVVSPLKRLGPKLAATVQLALMTLIVLVQFIVFISYASEGSVRIGFGLSMMTGCISAIVLLLIFHVVFFTGLSISKAQQSSRSIMEMIPLLIAFHVTELDAPHLGQKFRIRTSMMTMMMVPFVLGFLLGIAFLITRAVPFAVSCPILVEVGFFAASFFLEPLSNRMSSAFLNFSLWMICTVWIFDSFVFGFREYEQAWLSTTIVATLIALLFCGLSGLCLKYGSAKLLRGSLILLLVYFAVCWILQFIFIRYTFALFCLALVVHSLFSSFRSFAVNSFGHFCIVATATLLLIALVLSGWDFTTLQNSSPVSLAPEATTFPGPSLSDLELYHRYPVCMLSFTPSSVTLPTNLLPLSIIDLALLVELAASIPGSLAREVDSKNWFPEDRFTLADTVYQTSESTLTVTTAVSTVDQVHVMILQSTNPLQTILGSTLWVDAMSLATFTSLMPSSWASKFIFVSSFLIPLIPFSWQSEISDLESWLKTYRQDHPDVTIYLAGQQYAGSVATIIGARIEEQTIAFSTRGALYLAQRMHFPANNYRRFVLEVGTSSGLYNSYGGVDVSVFQQLRCTDESAVDAKCYGMDSVARELIQSCGILDNRRGHK